ncbi:hypothetical protein SCB17_003097 [Clostridium perfringens]|nr:hypothetical protein [Clostridium perfringens]
MFMQWVTYCIVQELILLGKVLAGDLTKSKKVFIAGAILTIITGMITAFNLYFYCIAPERYLLDWLIANVVIFIINIYVDICNWDSTKYKGIL